MVSITCLWEFNGHAIPPPLHPAWLYSATHPRRLMTAADIQTLTSAGRWAATMLTFCLQTPALTAPAGVCRAEIGPGSVGGKPSPASGHQSILGRHPQAPGLPSLRVMVPCSIHLSISADVGLFFSTWRKHGISERARAPLHVMRIICLQPALNVPGPGERT